MIRIKKHRSRVKPVSGYIFCRPYDSGKCTACQLSPLLSPLVSNINYFNEHYVYDTQEFEYTTIDRCHGLLVLRADDTTIR